MKNVSNGGKITNEAKVLCNCKNRVASLPPNNDIGLNFVLLSRHNFSTFNYSFDSNIVKTSNIGFLSIN